MVPKVIKVTLELMVYRVTLVKKVIKVKSVQLV